MSEVQTQIIDILKEMFPKGANLHEPRFQGNEWEYVKECIDTGWVSSAGKFVEKFEKSLAEFTGVKHAIATGSGTGALHICLELADVKRGDEVLVPALTFVAAANAVSYCGATPHFVDSATNTLGIDPAKLDEYLKEIATVSSDGCMNKKTEKRIRAMLPVHIYGHPCDLDQLVEIANRYKIILIEDAAESLGSFYKNKHTGNFGLLSAISFNGNKIVTSGGGGAVLTNDSKLAQLAKHVSTTAKLPHQWKFEHDQIGYNYRMPNLNAALGCAQLEELPKFLKAKKALHYRYKDVFKDFIGLKLFEPTDFSDCNYWLNLIILDESMFDMRDLILNTTNNSGIGTRPAWILLNQLIPFRECPSMDLNQSERLEKAMICLPSSSFL